MSAHAGTACQRKRGCSYSTNFYWLSKGEQNLSVNRLLSDLSGEVKGRCVLCSSLDLSFRGWIMILHYARPVVSLIRHRSVHVAVSRLYHADKVATVGSQPDSQSPVFQVGHAWSLGLKLLQPTGSGDSSAATVVHVLSLCTYLKRQWSSSYIIHIQ